MSNPPVITLRGASAPYSVISAMAYVQSTLGGNNLPMLGSEVSQLVSFRFYNNWSAAGSITTADNVSITLYDGADPSSHTATKSVVAQSWIRVYETGFGESKGSPGLYSQYLGNDTAIGRAGTDKYIPELGSDGTTTPHIRAGTNTNGVGFIEFASYAEMPEAVGFASYNFAVSMVYDYIV